VQLTKLHQDLAAERDERLTGVSANKRALQSLDGTVTQQLKDMRHTLETEVVDRESGDDRSLKLNAEIRASVESERIAREAAVKELEKSQKTSRLALDQERNDRAGAGEDLNAAIADLKTIVIQTKKETNDQIDDQHDELSQLRGSLQKFESKVSIEFSDVRTALDNEIHYQKSSLEKLDKRLMELRGAVLVAVRGGGPAHVKT